MLRHPFPILLLQYYRRGLSNKDFNFEMFVTSNLPNFDSMHILSLLLQYYLKIRLF